MTYHKNNYYSWYKRKRIKPLSVRIQLIDLPKQDFTSPEIFEMNGYCRQIVKRLVARYNNIGIKGLVNKPYNGWPKKLSIHRRKGLSSSTDADPKALDGTDILYVRDLQRIFEKEFGAVYSLDDIYKLLRRLGYSFSKPHSKN